MIELDITLPLARFPLRVVAKLGGDTVAVLGPSGSGKSTLLEALAGLRNRASGRIAVKGETLMDTPAAVFVRPRAAGSGYVPQDACLFPHLDVARTCGSACAAGEPSSLSARRFDPRDRWLLGGIPPRCPAASASVGPRPGDRHGAQALLLDEPLAAVDPELKERSPLLLLVRETLRSPFLYVTHNAGERSAVAQEALVPGKARSSSRDLPTSPPLHVPGRPRGRFDNILEGRSRRRLAEAIPGSCAWARRRYASARRKGPYTAGPRPCFRWRRGRLVSAACSRESRPQRSPRQVIYREISGASAWIRIASAAGIDGARDRPRGRELELEPGADVWIAVKTHAFRGSGNPKTALWSAALAGHSIARMVRAWRVPALPSSRDPRPDGRATRNASAIRPDRGRPRPRRNPAPRPNTGSSISGSASERHGSERQAGRRESHHPDPRRLRPGEEWTGAGGLTGTSLTCTRSRRRWHKTWLDDKGNVLLLEGAFRGVGWCSRATQPARW